MPNTAPEPGALVHVAVGVVVNPRGDVLIALRDESRHQGGLWEFPGGKLEEGEDVVDALRRELLEEVHLEVENCIPFLEVRHDYGDKQVFLDIWLVDHFKGIASGREGQPVKWVPIDELPAYEFPRANAVIVQRLLDLRRDRLQAGRASLESEETD